LAGSYTYYSGRFISVPGTKKLTIPPGNPSVEVANRSEPEDGGSTFVGRHQFLIYRLFSLTGLFVGGYVLVHLATNASVLAGAGVFQDQVDRIHSLGPLLPFVEWTFIFIPILFHAVVGLSIVFGCVPNVTEYQYGSNLRFTLQRYTGMLIALFILFHIWQMHHLGSAIGGGKFDPHHATSSAAAAIHSLPIQIAYAVGTLCAVFHFANGIWTFGITWGIWTSAAAQRRAGYVCTAFGLLLAAVGMGALYGMSTADIAKAEMIENRRIERAHSDDFDAPQGDASKPAASSSEGN
jgi:succinate dehydrogenase / fumarate reductase, cytochrome b subunit